MWVRFLPRQPNLILGRTLAGRRIGSEPIRKSSNLFAPAILPPSVIGNISGSEPEDREGISRFEPWGGSQKLGPSVIGNISDFESEDREGLSRFEPWGPSHIPPSSTWLGHLSLKQKKV